MNYLSEQERAEMSEVVSTELEKFFNSVLECIILEK